MNRPPCARLPWRRQGRDQPLATATPHIEPKWNAEAKDHLERTLCDLVCDGLLDIGDAQEAIIKDWIAAYHLYNE